MEDFSMLDESEVLSLAIWEKYLVFATAFGIADRVLSQLRIKYPEVADVDYMSNNGYSYIYMMDRYNFDRVISSGMQRAYHVGASQRARREAASSSGGGSFSSGGGGRRRLLWWRRPAVVAGGRNGR